MLARLTPALAGVFICIALLTGCATPAQTQRLLAAPPPAWPRQTLLTDVPFYAQDRYQCGPAALAMVLSASGLNITADELAPDVFVPARQGSLQAEMLAAARRRGRLAVVLPPRLESVLAEVEAGRPVVVLQNLSLPLAPIWHYAVVIGFDLEQREIVLHSGLEPQLRMPLAVFERTWARSQYWAMVAVDPQRLPKSADSSALLAAAAALERVQPQAARHAYQALSNQWPHLAATWFGLGNTAFAAKDFAQAAAAFERATLEAPEFADAFNNLALTHLALGQINQARTAATQAVARGGKRSERYQQTLKKIEQVSAASAGQSK